MKYIDNECKSQKSGVIDNGFDEDIYENPFIEPPAKPSCIYDHSEYYDDNPDDREGYDVDYGPDMPSARMKFQRNVDEEMSKV
jgi:hypothetical protein